MQVENRSRMSTPEGERFEILDNQEVEDEVVFESDVLDFCFIPKPDTERMKCCVRLYDADTQAELTNGYGEVVIEKDSTDRQYISFADFGWYDEERTMPVDRCRYRTWIEGDSASIWVEIFR